MTLDALAANTGSLDQAMVELPRILDSGRRSLAEIDPLLREAQPLLAGLRELAPDLRVGLDETYASVVQPLVPIIQGLTPLRRVAEPALGELRVLLRPLKELVTVIAPAARNLVPLLSYLTPRVQVDRRPLRPARSGDGLQGFGRQLRPRGLHPRPRRELRPAVAQPLERLSAARPRDQSAAVRGRVSAPVPVHRPAAERPDRAVRVKTPFSIGERTAFAGGLVLLAALVLMPWFAVEAHGEIAFGSEGGAFRWLGGIDLVLVAVALVAIGLPIYRRDSAKAPEAATLGVLVAAAGLLGAILILYRIIVQPDVPGDFFLEIGLDPAAHVVARVGAVFGLVAAIGILAGGVLAALERPVASRTSKPGARATRA